MVKILTIGGVMQDIFINCASTEMIHIRTADKKRSFIIFEQGRKIGVNSLQYRTGGGAANTAASFKKFGFKVESFFKTGNDAEASFIKNQLQGLGILIDHTIAAPNLPTGKSFIIPGPNHSGHALLAHRGANVTVQEEDIPYEAISTCDYLYITSLSDKASQVLPAVTQYARDHNKRIAANPGTSQLTANVESLVQSLSNIDILILNSYETNILMNSLSLQATAQSFTTDKKDAAHLPPLLKAPIAPLTTCFTLRHYFRETYRRGVKTTVVTNGSDGVYVSDGEHIYYHPSAEVDVHCTLGAGDAFGSTFVSFIAQGKSIQTAIRAGIINSASVVKQLDTTSGLLSYGQIEKELKAINPSLLQEFSL